MPQVYRQVEADGWLGGAVGELGSFARRASTGGSLADSLAREGWGPLAVSTSSRYSGAAARDEREEDGAGGVAKPAAFRF